ncbi:uncharacterized protein FOBCDRAFT_245574 [Fusarium oxysporum Fo47]|uniref:uncharacterized protein n=1 Tax=Fusarium oxysporum Fo47 TaxID=660027 RepID=UPI002869B6BE|nr:uncharacterized protein FOBCDRAFT_245574 [Fusarium oxysporum Fo47]WJG37210.1 hypothetical protein FOBCDRAFT_245574 [Fusarium oxysporum Fo47]
MSTPWLRSLRLFKTEKTFIFGKLLIQEKLIAWLHKRHMTRGLQRSQEGRALEGKSLHIIGYSEHAVADWANAVTLNNKRPGWVMGICSNYDPMFWDRTKLKMNNYWLTG